jgi:hypothetical protein
MTDQLYIVLHTHRFGSSTYVVKSDRMPTELQVIRCLELDYEGTRDESIAINLLESNEPAILDYIPGLDDADFRSEVDYNGTALRDHEDDVDG